MDMAPILILALIFASCDDRGSAPSGSKELTIQATLPNMDNYPTSLSSWSATLLTANADSAKIEPVSAKIASYQAASGTQGTEGYEPAVLVLSVPLQEYQSTFAVQYEAWNPNSKEPLGRTFQGIFSVDASAIGSTNIAAEISGSFTDITPQTLTYKISAPSGNYTFKFDASNASAYTLSLKPQTGKAVELQALTAVATDPTSSSEATLTLTFKAVDVPENTYAGTISFSQGGNDYTATINQIQVAPGAPNPTTSSPVPISQTVYGSITATLPGKLTSAYLAYLGVNDGVAMDSSDISLSYTVTGASFSGKETAVGALKTDGDNFTFATDSNIPTGNNYTVEVTATYKGTEYIASVGSVSVAGSGSSDTGTANLASATFYAQKANLTVSFGTASAPASYPSYGSAYTVTYTLLDDEGEAVGDAVPFAITDTAAAQIAAGTKSFVIPGLAVESMYSVKAVINSNGQNYTANGAMTGKTVSIDSTEPAAATANAVTAYFKEPTVVTIGTSSPVEVAALAGLSLASPVKLSLPSISNENIASSDLTVTFAQADQKVNATVAGTLTLNEGKEASELGTSPISLTGADLNLGNGVTITLSSITPAEAAENSANITAIAFTGAQAVINVEGTISSSNLKEQTGTLSGSISGESDDISLTQSNLTIATKPVSATSGSVTISMTELKVGTIKGSVTCSLTDGISITTMTWTSVSGTVGSSTVTGVALTGTYANGTFTVSDDANSVTFTISA